MFRVTGSPRIRSKSSTGKSWLRSVKSWPCPRNGHANPQHITDHRVPMGVSRAALIVAPLRPISWSASRRTGSLGSKRGAIAAKCLGLRQYADTSSRRTAVPMTNVAALGVIKADTSSKLALDRTALAYERTMLSWVRTATSLISFGFSIQQFFRIARASVPESNRLIGPQEFGLMMIVIGLLALLLATLEHRSAIQALKVQYPVTEQYPELPRSRARVTAALIAILGVLALLSMMFRE